MPARVHAYFELLHDNARAYKAHRNRFASAMKNANEYGLIPVTLKRVDNGSETRETCREDGKAYKLVQRKWEAEPGSKQGHRNIGDAEMPLPASVFGRPRGRAKPVRLFFW